MLWRTKSGALTWSIFNGNIIKSTERSKENFASKDRKKKMILWRCSMLPFFIPFLSFCLSKPLRPTENFINVSFLHSILFFYVKSVLHMKCKMKERKYEEILRIYFHVCCENSLLVLFRWPSFEAPTHVQHVMWMNRYNAWKFLNTARRKQWSRMSLRGVLSWFFP